MAIKTEEKKRLIAVARCKMWSCEYCAEKNRKKWRAIILDFVNSSKLNWSWFTMTAHRRTHNNENVIRATYINLRTSFTKLMKRIRRKFKDATIAYVRIFEQHKSGALHIHCIISVHWDDIRMRNKGKENEYSDSTWLRTNVVQVGAGYMTHCENIQTDKSYLAVGYVTKYMTKTGQSEQKFLKGIRRIQTSRHMKFGGASNGEVEFNLSTGYWITQYEADLQNGISVYNLTEKRSITYDDYHDTTVYPK